MNCWEFKKCGQDKLGTHNKAFGLCPAFSKDAGEACWLVPGTLCDGTPAKGFIQKRNHCMECDFYKQSDQGHRMKVRRQLQS